MANKKSTDDGATGAGDEPAIEARPTAAGDEWGQDPRIDAMLTQRQVAKQARNFAEADRIRDALKAEGIEIVDTPAGPHWRRGKPK